MGIFIIMKLFVLSLLSGFQFVPKLTMRVEVRGPLTINSSTLAWKIPWTEEPGRLQSVGSLRVGHD